MKRTTAPGSVSGLHVDRNAGSGTPGTKGVAEDRNNLQEEICHVVERLSVSLNGADQHQLTKAIIGLSHQVGEMVFMETEETPDEYFPAIPRNVDQDIDIAHWPLLVPKLRAVKAKIIGTTDFTVSVSGSNVTFPATAAGIAAVQLIVNDAIVSGWLNGGEDPGDDAADYGTATTRRTLTIGGTDYAIIGANATTRIVALSASPPSGTQTASLYTYRVAGSATTARLHKITGFVPVAAGDADGEVVGGWRKMDRGQGHKHGATDGQSFMRTIATGGTYDRPPGATLVADPVTSSPVSDGNGTPRTGKTTDPRTIGQHAYTWGGVYIAA